MDLNTIGERLRAEREKKNLSQGDIEKRTGMLRCYISRIENGHTRPGLDTLHRFAAAIDIPVTALFEDGPPPSPGRALSDADREFLIEVNKCSSGLTNRERAWLLKMVKKFAERLGEGKIGPIPVRPDLAGES